MITFNGGSWKSTAILRRVSHIVGCGGDFHSQQDGYDYMLGDSNNWWMNVSEENREYTLAYRYDSTWTQEDRDALKRAICLLLSIRRDNNF